MHGPHQNYPQQPHPFHQYPPQPPHQPRKKRTGLIITAILAAVALVGGGVTAVLLINRDDEKPAAQQESGPPDADILEERITNEVVKYGDVPVIDACTLMSATVLEETGFADVAHGGHSQTYVPKSVPGGTVRKARDAISACRYDVQKPDRIDFIALDVHQMPFNDPLPARAISDDVEITVGGLKAFTKMSDSRKPDDFFTRIYSADGRTAAYLKAARLADNEELDYQAAHAKLLERVALNLAKATGAQTRYAYAGRYQNVPPACDVLTSELFEDLAQAKDSGVVQAEINESEGRQESTSKKTNVTEYFYFTSQMCQRSSPEWHTGKGASLKMELSVHRDAHSAANYEPACDPDSTSRKLLGEATDATEKVGDGAACAFPIGNSLVFSYIVGRTQVRLTPYGSWAPKDAEQFVAKFTPIARKTADEVRKAIG